MSRGYSRIILVGNLGRDPEMRYTPAGTPVTNFTMAVNRRRRSGEEYIDETDWYRVSAFGRQAEIADQYLRRGMKVLVDGQPSINRYVGNDGVERTSIDVRADNFQMLTSREEMAAMQGQTSGSSNHEQSSQPESDDQFDDEDLDDVPF